MAKKRAALSRREKRVPGSAAFTNSMTKRELAELKRLAQMSDSKIDFSDAPEAPSRTRTLVGRFYRPVKQHISLRVDADVLAWFRSRGAKYQTYINQVLRREMQSRPPSSR
jgi:uncharacterized protein (DUF4415 family)